jgi:hypothetical protein
MSIGWATTTSRCRESRCVGLALVLAHHLVEARYDKDGVYAVLDAAMLCHIAYVIDDQPYCTPDFVAFAYRK